jgi:hypothetical protein
MDSIAYLCCPFNSREIAFGESGNGENEWMRKG